MAKIIVYGDIDLFALYLKIDGGKEVAVTGKHAKSFTIPAGTHHIFATTVTKLERTASRFSDGSFVSNITAAVQNSTNTTLSGELDFDEDDVLLIEVEQKGLKTLVYSKLVSAADANDYLQTYKVVEYHAKKTWKKFALLTVAVVLVSLLLLVLLFVFASSNSSGHF